MHSFITLGGWMTILGGISLWGQVGSADWGIAIGTILFISVAIILLGFNAWSAFKNREGKTRSAPRRIERQVIDNLPPGSCTGGLTTFLLVAPIGGAAALLLALAAFKLLKAFGVETANTIVTTFFLSPVLWAAIATWMVIDTTIMRKTTLLFCFAALSALHLAWGQ